MADYKSQRIDRGSTAEILQLLEAFSSGHQRNKAGFNDLYKEYGDGLSSIYDNKRKNQFDKYFQSNKLNMDADTLAKYELLDQQFKNQEELNNNYTQGLEKTRAIGREVESALISYSDINQDTSLSELEKNDLRIEKMAKVQKLTEDYTTFSGDFRAQHGQRLGTAGFREDAAYISNLNEMFTFGIVQAQDDYLLDSAEANALSLGIQRGSYQPIQDYRINESNRNRELDSMQHKQMEELYSDYELNNSYIGKANEFLTLAEISNNTEGLYSVDEVNKAKTDMAALSEQIIFSSEGEDYTYEGLLDSESSELQLLDEARANIEETYSKLDNINSIYVKRHGTSYLESINTSGNESVKFAIDSILNPQKVIQKPTIYDDADYNKDGVVDKAEREQYNAAQSKEIIVKNQVPLVDIEKEKEKIITSYGTPQLEEKATKIQQKQVEYNNLISSGFNVDEILRLEKGDIKREPADIVRERLMKNLPQGIGTTVSEKEILDKKDISRLKNLHGSLSVNRMLREGYDYDSSTGNYTSKKPTDVLKINYEELGELEELYKTDLEKMKSLEKEYYGRKDVGAPVGEIKNQIQELFSKWYGSNIKEWAPDIYASGGNYKSRIEKLDKDRYYLGKDPGQALAPFIWQLRREYDISKAKFSKEQEKFNKFKVKLQQ